MKLILITILICLILIAGSNQEKTIRLNRYKDKRAKELYQDSLESAYIYKTQALRIYVPIALKK